MKDPAGHSGERPTNAPDHMGGTPAPESGTYEQLNVFARPTGRRVTVRKGEMLPPLPRGFSWRRVDGG